MRKTRGSSNNALYSSNQPTKDDINKAFLKTIQQRCIVHMIRNSVKYANYKDLKEVTRDLR